MFPGKVAVYPNGIIVSDSGHNRILLADAEGVVKVRYGSIRIWKWVSIDLNICEVFNVLDVSLQLQF